MTPSNLPASIRARLWNQARATDREPQELLEHFAIERFLYRLSRSTHRDQLILKGALMLRVWDAPMSRPTRDIDFLGRLDNSVESLTAAIREVCRTEVPNDGMKFDPDTVHASRITEGADYPGVRLHFEAHLDSARVRMQIDVGFGDAVETGISDIDYPTILDMEPPSLRGYPREAVVAEKFQAMVVLGAINSRMKDFYDLWLLASRFDFDGPALAGAISATFAQRETEIEQDPIALSTEFAESDPATRLWTAFVGRSHLDQAPKSLVEVTHLLGEFLHPVARALGDGRDWTMTWKAGGPWS